MDEATDSFHFSPTSYQLAQQVRGTNPGSGYDPNPEWFGSSFGVSEGPLESGGEGTDGFGVPAAIPSLASATGSGDWRDGGAGESCWAYSLKLRIVSSVK